MYSSCKYTTIGVEKKNSMPVCGASYCRTKQKRMFVSILRVVDVVVVMKLLLLLLVVEVSSRNVGKGCPKDLSCEKCASFRIVYLSCVASWGRCFGNNQYLCMYISSS